MYDDDPKPREKWPGVMRRDLTIASSAWRPLGERMASNAGFYSFPREATLRDFKPDGSSTHKMHVGRLPGAVRALAFEKLGPNDSEAKIEYCVLEA